MREGGIERGRGGVREREREKKGTKEERKEGERGERNISLHHR